MNERVLAGRFELEGLIGRGGMAEVYRAYDSHLDRLVAIKVLLPRFTDDAEFQERFAEEARRAARLSHPNIVTVLDTGTDEATGLRFMVMELVEGRSLQEAIAAGGLMEDRALEVCADVCAALQYAHDRGLVHRDIKPGNILLSDDGQVKVTDFGIARAIDSDSNVTQTAAVLGTAAYLAPEQAQGEVVDARTDLYALGVVLYELLTGLQPFQGDTPVTVAYQHVQELARPPRDLVPSISPAAEAITMRGMAKNQNNRYQSADEFRDDVLRALSGRGVLAPAVLHADETALLDVVARDRAPVGAQAEQRRRRLGFIALGVGSFLAAVIVAVLLVGAFTGEDVALREVPDVTDQPEEQAKEILRLRGLEPFTIDTVPDESIAAGRVARQDPGPDQRVPDGSTVRLFISSGPEQVSVPDLADLTSDEAIVALREAGLRLGDRTSEVDEDRPPGVVIRSEPASGVLVAPNTPVDLVLSAEEETLRVRSVVFQSEAAATLALEEQGFTVDVVREFSDTVEAGSVIRQSPEPTEELAPGEAVTIVVSRGPQDPETEEPTATEEPTEEPSPTETEEPSPTETEEPSPSPTPSPTPTPTPSPTTPPPSPTETTSPSPSPTETSS